MQKSNDFTVTQKLRNGEMKKSKSSPQVCVYNCDQDLCAVPGLGDGRHRPNRKMPASLWLDMLVLWSKLMTTKHMLLKLDNTVYNSSICFNDYFLSMFF